MAELRSLFHGGSIWYFWAFQRRGAFSGGEKADERVVASYLAATHPPLSSADTHNGLLRAAVGERIVPGRDFMLQPSQIKLKYVGPARGTPSR